MSARNPDPGKRRGGEGPVENTPEGWIVDVDDMPLYRLAIEHGPPRPHLYRFILSQEVRSKRVLAMWAASVALCTTAAITGWWILLYGGLAILILRCFLVQRAIRLLRDCPAVTGVIEGDFRDRKIPSTPSRVSVRLAGGQKIFALVSASLLHHFLGAGEQIEVLVLYLARPEFSFIIGARAVCSGETAGHAKALL